MTLQHSISLLQSWTQSLWAQLPEPVRAAINAYPIIPLALNSLLAIFVLRYLNRALTYWSLGNCSAKKWNKDRELVLITGGSSGIGQHVVLQLAERGVRCIVLDIQAPTYTLRTCSFALCPILASPANATAAKSAHFYKTDITSTEALHATAERVRADHGHPTVLVNNAGVGHDGTILNEPESKIRQTFEVNTLSHFLTVREFLPAMLERNHGHVITVASMASFVTLGEMVDYCCSKASALAFHEGLGQEIRYWYQKPGVKTSVIHPYWVRTPMIQQLTEAGDLFKPPVLTVERVATAITRQVVSGKSGQVILPEAYSVASMLRAFPTWLQEHVRGAASKDILRLRQMQK
ncbi:SDR family oxidoreductase [Aspergillus saccharolyticus JOP 1030-1]|uniref:Short-chain dehydrogenase/reductase 3 n=1 Tax=Aspergillus saccharolyticus JOP 1030-1 TaxID=1450539 RepID=A0A318Z8E8_9EURO|nr:short-chain dehydrogenase/reductase 2 [Aspergillus saccharolyticus JOP 1030-1]PYH41033.1 short-chain dehydrogenase/reductase 2 [Aspergillus saccharolyticus JOP 1030-1]